jgi:hypothetical protein
LELGCVEGEVYAMKQNLLRIFGKLLSIGMTLVLTGLIIFLAIKSFPISEAGDLAYPEPINIQLTPSSVSSEAQCELYFSFRSGLTNDQRNMISEDYNNCVNARKTPIPIGIVKPIPSVLPESNKIPFFRRVAGNGAIIETNFSSLKSNYRIINQWVADSDNTHIIIYAGGRIIESGSGYSTLDDLSWPGVLVVATTDSNGKTLLQKNGVFWTPTNAGPIRIIDASGNTLILTAYNGTLFSFDVDKLVFLPIKNTFQFNRKIGSGMLVENGNSNYQIDNYNFVNYWSYYNKELGTITILAGKEKTNSQKGALVVVVSSINDFTKITEEVVYLTNLDDGALRIVDADSEKLTLVSENGLVYEFGFNSRQFVSLPSGSSTISGISLINESTPSGMNLLSSTSTPTRTTTPTRTPTPRPSSTALPTYNPYP